MLHTEAQTTFPFFGVQDGEVLELGNVTATVMHSPGHTPEHISLLVADRTRSSEPWFVLTGHGLMVGDMGRTELATSAEDGARALFSTAQKLKALPDYLEVLPGAYSGVGLRAAPERETLFDHRLRETQQSGLPHR